MADDDRLPYYVRLWGSNPRGNKLNEYLAFDGGQCFLNLRDEAELNELVAEMVRRYGASEESIEKFWVTADDMITEENRAVLRPSLARLKATRTARNPNPPLSSAFTLRDVDDATLIGELARRLSERKSRKA